MSYSNSDVNINQFYENFIIHAPEYTPQSVGWTTKETQYKRFTVLYGIVDSTSDLILDYGCGFGALIDFLIFKNHDITKYLGIDINETYIAAAKKKYPNNDFKLTTLNKVNVYYDYLLGSGVFTVGRTWLDILNDLKVAYTSANKGIAFNLLHENYVNDNEFFRGYNPNKIYKELKSQFDNVELIDNYLPGEDFTIYIKKR